MAEGQQISGFVSTALAKGMSKAELRGLLLKGGWPKQMVEDYLSRIPAAAPIVRSVILQCKGIQKKGGGAQILDNINLEIGRGEIFGIVGAGDSGKSTLLHIMVGLLAPDAGDVQFIENNQTRSVTRDSTVRGRLGFSPQLPSFFDDLTVKENIMQFAALHGMSDTAQKNAAISLVRIVRLEKQQDRLASHLSLGERKRLDLACALVHDPAVLILDDPAVELDSLQQRELWATLRDVAAKGMTIVIASNFLSDLETLCTRMGILRSGRITEIGTPADLRVVYSHDFEIRIKTEQMSYSQIASLLTADTQSGVKKITRAGEYLMFYTPEPPIALRQVLAAIAKADDTIVSIDVMRPTIQEVFEALSSR